jgi:hypothetical protein
MSMTGRYLRVAPEVVFGIQADPTSLLTVLFPDIESPDHLARYLDIDKTWHVIHFLLNGHPWEGSGPLFNAVLGGAPLSSEDLGYGPARHLTASEVGPTAEALESVSAGQLWTRLSSLDDAQLRAADIYWQITAASEKYLTDNFTALQRFFRTAAHASESVILWVA